METLEDRYQRLLTTPSDIRAHLHKLRALASACDHVVELGVRGGNSTTALLAGRPRRLTCYDLHPCPVTDELARLAGRCEFRFLLGDSRRVEIAPCELLFIDTWHTYLQLCGELGRHARHATSRIALHDTETFGRVGEDGGPGLSPAIDELLGRGGWEIESHDPRDNGLTVLTRQ